MCRHLVALLPISIGNRLAHRRSRRVPSRSGSFIGGRGAHLLLPRGSRGRRLLPGWALPLFIRRVVKERAWAGWGLLGRWGVGRIIDKSIFKINRFIDIFAVHLPF